MILAFYLVMCVLGVFIVGGIWAVAGLCIGIALQAVFNP
jgi:hypothetical protein